jgi:hypothetical protein
MSGKRTISPQLQFMQRQWIHSCVIMQDGSRPSTATSAFRSDRGGTRSFLYLAALTSLMLLSRRPCFLARTPLPLPPTPLPLSACRWSRMNTDFPPSSVSPSFQPAWTPAPQLPIVAVLICGSGSDWFLTRRARARTRGENSATAHSGRNDPLCSRGSPSGATRPTHPARA